MDKLISQQAAIDVVAKWIFEVFGIKESDGTATVFKRLRELPSIQPETNCSEIPNNSDTISRQEAIDALDKRFDSIPMEQTTEILLLRKDLRNLPSAQPERKTAEWIYGENGGQDGWYCSKCGLFIPWDYEYYGLDNIDFITDFHTCPKCDRKMLKYTGMRGEQDE